MLRGNPRQSKSYDPNAKGRGLFAKGKVVYSSQGKGYMILNRS